MVDPIVISVNVVDQSVLYLQSCNHLFAGVALYRFHDIPFGTQIHILQVRCYVG